MLLTWGAVFAPVLLMLLRTVEAVAQVSSSISPLGPSSPQQGTAHLEVQRQSRGTMGPMLMTLGWQLKARPAASLPSQSEPPRLYHS